MAFPGTTTIATLRAPGGEETRELARHWPERIRKGEPGAFRDLFSGHAGELLGFARCFTGDQKRAEGIVEDAFIDLYRSRGSLPPRVPPRNALYRLLVARLLAEIGGNGNRCVEPAVVSGAPRVLQALMRLPVRHRLALLLHRVSSLSAKERAASLRVPVDEYHRLVLDASRALATELQDDCAGRREAS